MPAIKVTEVKFSMAQRSTAFKKCFEIIKYLFFFSSAIFLGIYSNRLRLFEREDLGIIQKWVQALLLFLVLFNDPFFYFQEGLGLFYTIM